MFPILCIIGNTASVYLIGNMGNETGSLSETAIGATIGSIAGISAIVAELCYIFLVKYDMKEIGNILLAAGIASGVILTTTFAMNGFNNSRTYKEGVTVPPVSVNAYEVRYGAVTKTDVVTTLNVMSFSF